MIIHLIRPAHGTNARSRSRGTMVRRYPRINRPAAHPLFCLAPHGVFRASRITPRAVSSYLAFSPLPALFSKNRRCVFCDTFRQPPSRPRGTNVARVFYAACCRMVFGLSSSKSRQRRTHQRSPAIGREFSTKNPNLETRKPRMLRFDIECQGRARSPLRAAFVGPSACTECPPYRLWSGRLALLRMLAA